MRQHWATHLIGAPWVPNAVGPHAYYCWGLVRHLVAQRHGLDLPLVAVNDDTVPGGDHQAVLRLAVQAGWHLVADRRPQPDDVVLMRGPAGRHVGYMVRANGYLGVLHADGHMTPQGPKGSVVYQRLEEATADGYHDYEFWRRS